MCVVLCNPTLPYPFNKRKEEFGFYPTDDRKSKNWPNINLHFILTWKLYRIFTMKARIFKDKNLIADPPWVERDDVRKKGISIL